MFLVRGSNPSNGKRAPTIKVSTLFWKGCTNSKYFNFLTYGFEASYISAKYSLSYFSQNSFVSKENESKSLFQIWISFTFIILSTN